MIFDVPTFRSERVASLEVASKGTVLTRDLFCVDAA